MEGNSKIGWIIITNCYIITASSGITCAIAYCVFNRIDTCRQNHRLPTVYPGSAFTDIVVIVGVPQLSEEEAKAWMLNGEVHWLAGLVNIVVFAGQAIVGGVISGLHGSFDINNYIVTNLRPRPN